MDKSEMLSRAIGITANLFDNKMDKGGAPYMLHCLAVMNGVSHLGYEVMAAAVMHDIVEDCDVTVNDLRRWGFSNYVCFMVDQMTHLHSETYENYIKRISCNSDCTAIKLADLRHNMDPSRLVDLSDKSLERMKKYHRSYQYLINKKGCADD